MDFGYSERVRELSERLSAFMDERVVPGEASHRAEVAAAGDPHALTPTRRALAEEARRRGLWNLFMPDPRYGPGLTNVEYAPLAEISGRSLLAPEALNCGAPDTGNMEILAELGTPEQRERWLGPLLAGEIRSAFAMTEPDVASSDATNIRTRIVRDGDEYVIDGRKWWTTGAADPRLAVMIVMGVGDPQAERHRRQSAVIVPVPSEGLRILRSLPVLGYQDAQGHGELAFEGVRVPAANLLGEEGGGFAVAQARLGPGRIHHCMRALGMAERALCLMCRRVLAREAFGGPLADKGTVQDWIAEARIRIESARLFVLKTAWLMDTAGKSAARTEISAVKVLCAEVATWVVDRAIQAHGAAGLSDDTPLAGFWALARALHILDGPDEVHRMVIARRELARHRSGPLS